MEWALDDLPAAHATAIAADLLVIGLLLARASGAVTRGVSWASPRAYAWAAYPYTLPSCSRDQCKRLTRGLACVGALLALTSRRRLSAALGAAVAVAAMAVKFAAVVPAPLARRALARSPRLRAHAHACGGAIRLRRRSGEPTTARSVTRRVAPRRSASGVSRPR